MKTGFLFTIIVLFFSFISYGQLTEDFTDGSFTETPAWTGDNNSWIIFNGQLRSNAAIANSSFYLSTPSFLVMGTQWEFYVKLSYNTSGTNYVDIFLTSDSENLKTAQNGYFIRIGGTKDEISLYKKVAGIPTLLINGTDGITNTTSNTLKIKVICTAGHQWTLERDVAGTGAAFTTEGTVTDASLTSSQYFGVLVQQSTSSFFYKHFFDDFKVTPIDILPPHVTNVHVLSANSLEITFSETLNQVSAQSLDNYTVNYAMGNPVSATLSASVSIPDGSKVIIQYQNEFVSRQPYELTVTGVEDASRNAIIVPQAHNFTYIAPFTPQFRDIVINEIFADPSPAVDLPEGEFVEIYNNTTHEINMAGYTFTDGTSTATFGTLNLASHSYLIICNTTNAALFAPFGNVAGLSGFPSLNNGGETLTLKNPSGKIIDKVTYAAAWYNDAIKDDGGWTLEQINTEAFCNNSQNWIASGNETGGTPGRQNSAFDSTPDLTMPVLQSVRITGAKQLELIFSETMDSLLLKNVGAYAIDKNISVSAVVPLLPDYAAVQITLDQQPEPGLLYTITVSGLTDCPGNKMNPSSLTFGTGAVPQKYELLITEIMADESPKMGLPEAEFIELYNPTNKLLSADNLIFNDANGSVKLKGSTVLPKERVLLCASGAVALLSAYGPCISVPNFSLNNSGELLTLTNAEGKLIHAVQYSPDWYRDKNQANGGWSLEMIDTGNPCGDENNWAASEDPSGGTPGKLNSTNAAKPDLTPPAGFQVTVTDSLHLKLLFDEKLDSVAASLTSHYRLQDMVIVSVEVKSPLFREVVLQLATPLLKKVMYTLTAIHVKDCSGNISSTLVSNPFTLPEQGDSMDIVINEVLFNPRTGGVDFIEIYNRSAKYINLHHWQLANAENDNISNLMPLSNTDIIMQPQAYLVLATSRQNVKDHYPKAVDEKFLVMKSIPTYTDDAGSVILVNNVNRVVDRFDYSDDFHFSLIDDIEGVSLERINPEGTSNIRDNWHSAASTEGYATPGYRNSQYLAAQVPTAAFTIIPQLFTPDEDGWEDFTTFNYKFNTNGNMASITIFDAYGREVKKLVRNQLMAAEGFYSWDGTNEQGTKVRTGSYIVYFTLFDMHGKQQIFKERVVVGAKF